MHIILTARVTSRLKASAALALVLSLGLAVPQLVLAQDAAAPAPEASAKAKADKAAAPSVEKLIKQFRTSEWADAEAAAQLEAMAAEGNVKAALIMGQAYAKGWGRPVDPARAVEFLTIAEAADNPQAIKELGLLFAAEDNPQRDLARAYGYFARAAAMGDEGAALSQANALLKGVGVVADEVAAKALLEALAAKGNGIAWTRLGDMKLAAEDFTGAAEAWTRAAEAGRKDAYLKLGRVLRDKLNEGAKARAAFEQAEAVGDEKAARELVLGDLDGRLGDQPMDAAAQARRIETLLASDDKAVVLKLALRLTKGEPVPVPAETVLPALIRLMESGDSKAYFQLQAIAARGDVTLPSEATQAMAKTLSDMIAKAEPPMALRLTKTALSTGDTALAEQALTRLAADGYLPASAQLAILHLRGELGQSSSPEVGDELAAHVLASSDAEAVVLLARAASSAALQDKVNQIDVAAALERVALAGDAKAAPLFLRMTRSVKDLPDGTKRAQALVQTLGDTATNEDLLYEVVMLDIADARSQSDWSAIAEQVAQMDNAHFSRALMELARANKNILVRTLQARMAVEGKDVDQSGLLTTKTIRAIFALCKEKGILDQCQQGPIAPASIRAIAKAYANG